MSPKGSEAVGEAQRWASSANCCLMAFSQSSCSSRKPSKYHGAHLLPPISDSLLTHKHCVGENCWNSFARKKHSFYMQHCKTTESPSPLARSMNWNKAKKQCFLISTVPMSAPHLCDILFFQATIRLSGSPACGAPLVVSELPPFLSEAFEAPPSSSPVLHVFLRFHRFTRVL